MTIETYHIVLSSLGLAASLPALLELWWQHQRRPLLPIVVAIAFTGILAGEAFVDTARRDEVTRAEQQLSQLLRPWGLPFDDLSRQMNGFSPEVVREALKRGEEKRQVERVTREVRDSRSAQTYRIDVFVASDQRTAHR